MPLIFHYLKPRHLVVGLSILLLHLALTQISFYEFSLLLKDPAISYLQIEVQKSAPIRSDDALIGAPFNRILDRSYFSQAYGDGGYTPYLFFGDTNRRSFSLFELPFGLFDFQTARNYHLLLIILTAFWGVYGLAGYLYSNPYARVAAGVSYAFSAHFIVWIVGAYAIAEAGATFPLILYALFKLGESSQFRYLLLFLWACWEFTLLHYPPSQIFATYFLAFGLILYLVLISLYYLKSKQSPKAHLIRGLMAAWGFVLVVIGLSQVWLPRAQELLASPYAQRQYGVIGTSPIADKNQIAMLFFPSYYGDGAQWILNGNICEASYGLNLIIGILGFIAFFRFLTQYQSFPAKLALSWKEPAKFTVWALALASFYLLLASFSQRGLSFLTPLPLLNQIAPNRIYVLTGLGLCLLGGKELSHLLEGGSRPFYRFLGHLFGMVTVSFWMNHSIYNLPHTNHVIVALFALTLICFLPEWKSKFRSPLAVFLVFFLAFGWAYGFSPRIRQTDFDKNTHPLIKQLQKELETEFFYTAFIDTLQWNTAGYFRIPSLNGYDILAQPIQTWLGGLNGDPNYPPNPGSIDFHDTSSNRQLNVNLFKIGQNTQLFSHFALKYILSGKEVSLPHFQLVHSVEGLYLYRFDAFRPRLHSPGQIIALPPTELAQRAVQYRRSGPEMLNLVDSNELGSDTPPPGCPQPDTIFAQNGEAKGRFLHPLTENCLLAVAAKFNDNYQFFDQNHQQLKKIHNNEIFTATILPRGTSEVYMQFKNPDFARYGVYSISALALLILSLGFWVWQQRKREG